MTKINGSQYGETGFGLQLRSGPHSNIPTYLITHLIASTNMDEKGTKYFKGKGEIMYEC